MALTHPLYLLLLPALGLLVLLAFRKRPVPRGPWPLVLWLRGAIALLLILALAGLRVPAPARTVATVFVVDRSDSVPGDRQELAKAWVRQALSARGADDVAGIVTFSQTARVELPMGRHADHVAWSETGAGVGAGPSAGAGSNLGAALQLAADILPPADAGPRRRIVVLSDGNETRGDAQRDLLRPQLRDVEVSVIALEGWLNDSAITAFSAPPAVRLGESAEVRVALHSATQQDGRLRITAIGGEYQQVLYDQALQLEKGPREVVVNVGALPKGGWSFKAELLLDADGQPENNTSWSFTIVGGAARVLLVEGSPAPAVAAALADAQVQVQRVAPPALPAQLDALGAYDAVILNNVHAGDLGPTRQQALRDFVSQLGRGLVVIGGERTFGLGDYADTPLEEALPVTVQPPDRDQAATLALVLVIDRSGSMSATDTGDRRTTRMELAKEGAIQAVETVQEGDQVGVIAFDYESRWISEMRAIRGPADTRAVADRVATIQPDGGTDIYRAMEMAYRGLQQTQARVKHVIVLTDGEQGAPAPFPTLANAMRRSGITVSTLGIASTGSAAATLQNIARIGQGRHYTATDAREVPRIMTQEARLAGRSFKQEREFKPRLVTPAPAVRGLVPADFPALHGYVRVSPKPGAETVLSSDQEEVILSQWQFGLGRATAWTSDSDAEWSREWVGTAQFNQLWQQVARWSMPAPLTPGLAVQMRPHGDYVYVRVEATESTGEFRNHLITYADVADPSGAAKRVSLPQTAPGRYEGRFEVRDAGVYFLNVTQTDEGGSLVASQLSGYALPHLPEYRLSLPNEVLLERLAAETGGPVLTGPRDSWQRLGMLPSRPQDVWHYLVMAALLLFVVDVGVRRIRPTAHDVRAARSTVRSRLAQLRRPTVRLPSIRLHPIQGGRRS